VKDAQGNKVHVNGNLTSGENIGDSGIIQAYRAWKAQYSASLKDGNEYTLPGLPYTKEQLFFIAFGRVWAQNIKPAAAVQRVRTDPHSPNNFRVEGTLFNVPEFAKAFNCSAKAKLNPPKEQRCQFWG
jgi:endothelin-converting enzyme